jgi:type II secretory pathway pseudopilin PulG
MERSPWQRARDERGFALIAGLLVVMLLTTVTLFALLRLTATAATVSARQADDAAEGRAVDAALESAATAVRMDPTGEVGAPSDADGGCRRDVGSTNGPLTYDDPTGRRVEVTARCGNSSKRIPGDDAVTARVDIVGDRYRSPAGLADTVDWTTDCTGSTSATCYPWRAGIGATNFTPAFASSLASRQVSLVHTSDPRVPPLAATLGFTGDVTVKRSAMPLVNPPGQENSLGVSVAGRYRQGEPGPFRDVAGANDCGILSTGFPWIVPGAAVVDSDDAAGGATCGTPVATLDEGLPAPTAPWSVVRTGPPPTGYARTAPACPAPGGVAVVAPGAYDRTQTAALNALFRGGCPGRTVWFQPGNYWLDADDAANAPLERNSLVIDDPSVRVVMGEPTGGPTAAAAGAATFPDACSRSRPGVSLTLSPRTSFRHRRGLLSICDRTANGEGGGLPPAVWQVAGQGEDGGWVAGPGASGATFTVATATTGTDATATDSVTAPARAGVIDNQMATGVSTCAVRFGSCRTVGTIGAPGFQGGAQPSPAIAALPVASLDLLLRGSVRTDFGDGYVHRTFGSGQSSTVVSVFRAGEDTPLCTAGFGYIPDPRTPGAPDTIAYDLFSPSAGSVPGTPRCSDLRAADRLTRGDLWNSRVQVTITAYAGYHNSRVEHTTTMSIDGLELRAGWDLVQTGTATPSSPGWSDAQQVNVLDGRGATFSLTCSNKSCPTGTRSITATGFDNRTDPWVPTDGPLVRAGVIVTGDTSVRTKFLNDTKFSVSGVPDVVERSTMRVTVNLPGGGGCSAQWPRVPTFGQSVYVDLLSAPGTCGSVLTNARQLIGASLTLEAYLERQDFDKNNDGDGVFFLRVDHVRLSTVTGGTYRGPEAPHLLTQGAGRSTDLAMATVFGPWSTPAATLNVRWTGRPPIALDGSEPPLIGNQTVVASLGSSVAAGGRAGVVCCTGSQPGERAVTLDATIVEPDGRRRPAGSATIRVSDRNGPGTALRVERWSNATSP